MFNVHEAWVYQCAMAAQYAGRIGRYRDIQGNVRSFDGMTEDDDIVLIMMEIEWDQALARYARIREGAKAEVIHIQHHRAVRVDPIYEEELCKSLSRLSQ